MGANMDNEDRECMVCGRKGRARCATHVDLPGGFSTPVETTLDGVITEAGGMVVADVHADLAPLVVRLLNGAGHAFAPTMPAPSTPDDLPAPPDQSEVERRAVAIFGEQARWVVATTTPQTRAMLSHALALADAAKADAVTRAALQAEVDALRRVAGDAERTVDLLRQRLARAEAERDAARATLQDVVGRVRAAVEPF